jgi:hypothetical protein
VARGPDGSTCCGSRSTKLGAPGARAAGRTLELEHGTLREILGGPGLDAIERSITLTARGETGLVLD